MKRMSAALVAVFCLTAAAFAQQPSDAEARGLKGPVKTVRDEKVVVTRRDGKEVVAPRALDAVDLFDEQGRLAESTRFRPDGALLQKSVYTYRGPGEKTVTDYAPDGKVLREINFRQEPREKGSPGRLLVTGMGGELYNDVVRKFDAKGRLEEELVNDRDGSLMTRNVRKYVGDDGRMAEHLSYNAAGLLSQKYVFTGDATEVFIYDHEGGVRMTMRHRQPVNSEPDARGNWTKQVWTRTEHRPDADEEVTVITYRTITYR